ncbi:MAG: UDP-N-acetylmuramoyl-L-alanine--D-glutamate ligase, partial [Lachnospiraceae bacterium]|nr:UDP-N-acetylmuramoyl-L-alanine--D-glutamate ligase [Lachnospiraceae bacterium]
TGRRIREELTDDTGVFCTEDLKEAVSLAKKITREGEAVILSPAAASYGYFKNFEERGDVFKQLVIG